jgi:hypothetical protein
MGINTALARSLAVPQQVENRDIVIEARVVNAGGIPISHGARVQSVTERLRNRGHLTERQFQAAERLHRSYCLGILQARDSDSGGCSAWSPSGYSDAVLNAATDYRKAREAIGLRLWPLVWSVVIDDWTIERWRNERGNGTTPQAAAALFRHALDTLGDHYGL